MATASDRSLFLEHIRNTPLTVKQIKEMFSVAENTARNWITHPEVEQIPGSWPREFKRKASFAEEMPVKPRKVTGETLELPVPTREQREALFNSLMEDEPKAQFHFTKEFREANTIAHLEQLEAKLIASLVITRYYKQLMLDEETD